MKRTLRLFLAIGVVATVFTFSAARPAVAACVVASGTDTFDPGFHFVGAVTIAPGDSATFSVSGTGSFASGFFPGPGGGSVTTYANPGPGTISTQALIVVGTAGTFTWTLSLASGSCSQAWFTPGDARIAAQPWDRVVVYCNITATPPTLDVWGVTNDSQGHRLFTFTYSDLVKAGKKGITRKVEPLGTVFASTDGNGSFTVQWFGGPAGATGTKDFAKSFTCSFPK